jgi:hypothetical protein
VTSLLEESRSALNTIELIDVVCQIPNHPLMRDFLPRCITMAKK